MQRLSRGSARVSRAGERVLAIASFHCEFSSPCVNEIRGKHVSAGRRNQHARRVRYPDRSCSRGAYLNCQPGCGAILTRIDRSYAESAFCFCRAESLGRLPWPNSRRCWHNFRFISPVTVASIDEHRPRWQPADFSARQVNRVSGKVLPVTNRTCATSAALLFLVGLVTLTSAFNLPNRSPDLPSQLASFRTAVKPVPSLSSIN